MAAAAALHPSDEGPAPPPTRSFADILRNHPRPPPTTSHSFSRSLHLDQIAIVKEATTHKGKPAVFFSESEVTELAKPFQHTLVGKFSKGRPNMESLRKEFKAVGFNGEFSVGLLDSRHVLLRFAGEEDYLRCWLRGIWHFQGFPMRVLKWSPLFSVVAESPVVPVWISLPRLPVHFFSRGPLFSIARLIGEPLKIDASTATLTRPGVARVCVEVNLQGELPDKVWIGNGPTGFWQQVEYENLPQFCSVCHKIGHADANCRINPATRQELPHPQTIKQSEAQQVWKARPTMTQAEQISDTLTPKERESDKGDLQPNVAAIADPEKTRKGQVDGGLLHDVDVTDTTSNAKLPTHDQQPGSIAVLVEEGIASAADAIFLQLADRVISEPEEELRGTAQNRELALADQAVDEETDKGLQLNTGDASDLKGNSRRQAGELKSAMAEVSPVRQLDGEPMDEEVVELQHQMCNLPPRGEDRRKQHHGETPQPATMHFEDGSQILENTQLIVDPIGTQERPADTLLHSVADKAVALPSVVAKGALAEVEQSSRPQPSPTSDVPKFKDVFEEIKFEKIHGKIPLMYQKPFRHLRPRWKDEKNEEQEDHSQCDKDINQDQNLDHEQFTQVISKKARKQLSKTGKTMQTRQDVKSNSHAHSQYHKCGAPSCG